MPKRIIGSTKKIISSDIGIKNIRLPKSGVEKYWVKDVGSLCLEVTSKGVKTWYLFAGRGRHKLGHYLQNDTDATGGLSLKSASDQARTRKEEIRAGVDHKAIARREAERKEDTFAAVRDRFMRGYASELKANTQAGYKSALEHKKLKGWEGTPVHEITRRDVSKALDAIAATAPTMANRTLAYLRKFFKWCAEKGFLAEGESIPTDRVSPPLKNETRKRARKRWLSEDEIKVFLKATDRLGYPFGQHFKFLLLTGQRKQEVTGIQWSQIDQTAKQWTQEDNKADRTHIVPLSTPAMKLLKGLPVFEYESAGELKTSDYLFTTMGDRPLAGFSKAKSQLDAHISDIVKEEGLKGVFAEPWVIHDLRRTMTTHLRKAQVSRDVCGRLLNHAERGVTAQHYDQFDMLPEKTHAMEVWGRTIERIATGKTAKVRELRARSHG